jgi:hypothetical protein
VSKKSFLDRIEIPKPCLADWERMIGTEQIRFCEQCNKHVYNLSAMSRGEAAALIASAPKGRLCARLTRDTAGVTVTADDQPGLHLISRRASPIANAVVSAMLTVATPGTGGAAQMTIQRSSVTSAIDIRGARTDSQGAVAALSGTVAGPDGTVIQGAVLKLINEDTGDIQIAVSSNEGVFRFFVLEGGLFTLKAGGEGYYRAEANGLNLGNSSERRLNITLEPNRTTGGMGGAIAVPIVPLRELYSGSDRVVVGRVARSVRIRSDEESDLIRTSLIVSSTLKGEGNETVVNVYHFDYGDSEDPLSEGESLLAFLNHGGTIRDLKSNVGYAPADFSRGLKKLSSPELDAYVQRINELAQLAPSETTSEEELVEWLVRCTEDPATRWEGAVELASSSASLRASCKGETDPRGEAEEKESDGRVETSATDRSAPVAHELNDSATFAALLTIDQKERLIKALLSTDEITEGDEELIEVVKDFHDPRLFPFLVSRLRRTEDNPPESTGRVMQAVAELLHDKRIEALAEKYSELPYGDDEDENAAQDAATGMRCTMLRMFLQQVERTVPARNLKLGK